jgi:phenylacetate-CoA ligase
VRPEHIKTLDDYSNLVPITRKSDIIEDERSSLFGDRRGISADAIRAISMTGGTSGKGQERHALTQRDIEVTALAHAWACYVAGVRPGDLVLNTFPVGLTAGGQWLGRSLALQGAVPLMVGMYDTKRKVQELARFRPKAVMATTAYLLNIAVSASEMGIDVRDLGVSILLTAEAYSVDVIRRLEALWGAKAFSWYGSTQRLIAVSCEGGAVCDNQLGMLHVAPFLSRLEVLDPESGRQVSHGEEGEIVFTFLASEASPILRYGTGDRVLFHSSLETTCCSRQFDGFESGNIARYDDMIKVRGVNIWATALDKVVLPTDGVVEFQAAVVIDARGKEQANVCIEFEPDVATDSIESRLNDLGERLRDQTGIRFEVTQSIERLPRFEGDQHKPRRWHDERRRAVDTRE